mgnify:CR=1 FL=1
MNGISENLAGSSLTDKELRNQFKMIEKMTEEKKSVVKIFLDAFITKDKIKQLALYKDMGILSVDLFALKLIRFFEIKTMYHY